ncbi:hypothetical protein JCM10450v2_006183 [Rhodotorula kratochvilovae]
MPLLSLPIPGRHSRRGSVAEVKLSERVGRTAAVVSTIVKRAQRSSPAPPPLEPPPQAREPTTARSPSRQPRLPSLIRRFSVPSAVSPFAYTHDTASSTSLPAPAERPASRDAGSSDTIHAQTYPSVRAPLPLSPSTPSLCTASIYTTDTGLPNSDTSTLVPSTLHIPKAASVASLISCDSCGASWIGGDADSEVSIEDDVEEEDSSDASSFVCCEAAAVERAWRARYACEGGAVAGPAGRVAG